MTSELLTGFHIQGNAATSWFLGIQEDADFPPWLLVEFNTLMFASWMETFMEFHTMTSSAPPSACLSSSTSDGSKKFCTANWEPLTCIRLASHHDNLGHDPVPSAVLCSLAAPPPQYMMHKGTPWRNPFLIGNSTEISSSCVYQGNLCSSGFMDPSRSFRVQHSVYITNLLPGPGREVSAGLTGKTITEINPTPQREHSTLRLCMLL